MSEDIQTRQFAGEEYMNISNAARYAGYSGTGFRNLLRRLEGTEEEIPVWEFPGQRDKYIKKIDLDSYFQPKRVKP